jgi:hypothetical protein
MKARDLKIAGQRKETPGLVQGNHRSNNRATARAGCIHPGSPVRQHAPAHPGVIVVGDAWCSSGGGLIRPRSGCCWTRRYRPGPAGGLITLPAASAGWFSAAAAAFLAVFIDLDHFIAAGSPSISQAITLPGGFRTQPGLRPAVRTAGLGAGPPSGRLADLRRAGLSYLRCIH